MISSKEKLASVRGLMKEKGIDFHLLTSVDDIMWLLNIRGNDMTYSPLLTSFALVGEKQILRHITNMLLCLTIHLPLKRIQ